MDVHITVRAPSHRLRKAKYLHECNSRLTVVKYQYNIAMSMYVGRPFSYEQEIFSEILNMPEITCNHVTGTVFENVYFMVNTMDKLQFKDPFYVGN